MTARSARTVKRVAVIGAGAVGLATAVHLLRAGADVVVFDKDEPSRRASYGNAGHVVPALAVPLADMTNLQYFMTSKLRRNSPVSAPNLLGQRARRFTRHFLLEARPAAWRNSTRLMNTLNDEVVASFEALAGIGVKTSLQPAPFTAAFRLTGPARAFLTELAEIAHAGQGLGFRLLPRDELLAREPLCPSSYTLGVRIQDQAIIDPPAFLAGLQDWLIGNGVSVESEAIERITTPSGELVVSGAQGLTARFDAIVIAAGAASAPLARDHGFRGDILGGFGHSAWLSAAPRTEGMLYFPDRRLACTAFRGGIRASSLMRIAEPERYSPTFGAKRLRSILAQQFPDIEPHTITDDWYGARPLSLDGRPYVGGLKTSGVYMNSGHGMWGVTLAPVTGRLIAEAVMAGRQEIAVPGFSALR